ncbi:uncharacterized protein (DUF1015 family) [Saonia flava]|uniref:Uncharacterized protein (DUF1015 family) n=1 Tax=Saonia flava TaxID=523696 RepID=A0A846QRG1_9FLAO|nr:DUF1015 domain-containing protein [Saonia flava]NJB69570.1 uncharacterized protein (DUF1015 family) [Saonia flava]
MANIKAFKAIRPSQDKAALVASRSYQAYTKKERKGILSLNPFSFLHIIHPGYKLNKKLSGNKRFKLVHERYMEFLRDNILMKDAQDSLYIYQIEKEDFTCCGIFCGTSVEDYKNDVIKKHEATMQPREELFANYLETVGFNAEAVLITYPDNELISEIVCNKKMEVPNSFFTTTDKIKHKVWKISDKNTISLIQKEFKKMNSIYIADGHHRSASSHLFASNSKEKNPNHSGNEPYNFFMSYLIPESEIKIYEFNRLVKDLNGLSKKEFLSKLDVYYEVENLGFPLYKPKRKHQFTMYLDGEFYCLNLKNKVYNFTDALSKLDTQILFKTVLDPILAIKDLRNDKRIKYGYGKNNIKKMKNEIDCGKFKIGFSMVPVTINEIKAVADAGLVMPPKSTYIEPKLRSGLLIYEL